MEAEMWNNRHTYGWAAVSRLNVDSTITSSIVAHLMCYKCVTFGLGNFK
jgi:hypothetical protein